MSMLDSWTARKPSLNRIGTANTTSVQNSSRSFTSLVRLSSGMREGCKRGRGLLPPERNRSFGWLMVKWHTHHRFGVPSEAGSRDTLRVTNLSLFEPVRTCAANLVSSTYQCQRISAHSGAVVGPRSPI